MHLFHRFDSDDSGGLDPEDFRVAMLSLGIALSESELLHCMARMDTDADGFVTAAEFAECMKVAKKEKRLESDSKAREGGGVRRGKGKPPPDLSIAGMFY